MDLTYDLWLPIIQKVRAMTQQPPMEIVAAMSVIKDEEGQIKWSAILTGGLTAGLIAAATSLFSMQQTLTELRTRYESRSAYVDMIPALAERQKFVLEELTAIRSEKASATSDRFRGADAQRLEERLQRHIDVIDRRLNDLERGNKR